MRSSEIPAAFGGAVETGDKVSTRRRLFEFSERAVLAVLGTVLTGITTKIAPPWAIWICIAFVAVFLGLVVAQAVSIVYKLASEKSKVRGANRTISDDVQILLNRIQISLSTGYAAGLGAAMHLLQEEKVAEQATILAWQSHLRSLAGWAVKTTDLLSQKRIDSMGALRAGESLVDSYLEVHAAIVMAINGASIKNLTMVKTTWDPIEQNTRELASHLTALGKRINTRLPGFGIREFIAVSGLK